MYGFSLLSGFDFIGRNLPAKVRASPLLDCCGSGFITGASMTSRDLFFLGISLSSFDRER